MMTTAPYLIDGNHHNDHRGELYFCNAFDMKPVRRFYYIRPANTAVVRAWQGHRHESKWFLPICGEFDIKLVCVDDWSTPSRDLDWQDYRLSEQGGQVLFIPGGYANGFRALTGDACLLVFSDTSLPESQHDDFRFETNYWCCW